MCQAGDGHVQGREARECSESFQRGTYWYEDGKMGEEPWFGGQEHRIVF